MTDRELPADIEAERATLGSVLLNRDAIVPIASWLKPSHFSLEKHAWLYEAMLACYDAQIPPDTRTISDELSKRNRLDATGGITYLSTLVDSVPTSYHVEHYARIVERCSVQRALITAGCQITALGYRGNDPDRAIAEAYYSLDSATERPTTDDTLVPMSTIVDARYQEIHAAIERGEQVQLGIQTRLRDLDEMTGGLHKSDLIVLAARPGVGKSSLALTIAMQIAVGGRRIDIFSLEMSREQNLDRLIAMHTEANLMSVRMLALSEDGMAAYMGALGWAHALPIAIDDQTSLSVHDIRSRVLRRQAQLGAPELIIVDYLQLMNDPKSRTRFDIVSESVRGLKNLAKEFSTPILALCQLSRAVEGRPSHVPLLSDLRESGEIEQAADIVAFIYREEIYDRETDKKGIAELHIAKHRHGPLGVVPLHFDTRTTLFADLTYRTPAGY